MKTTKYIFVTGGVVSSLGKGIVAASLAKLIQARGYSVTNQKFDPYINVDPGTLNPYEHGECFVTEDGAETDLDLGHYERFSNSATSKNNNLTTGKLFKAVIDKERKGDYLGKTVQFVPHITDEIKRRIKILGKDNDVVITELGGTVGDIEAQVYVEAVRQLKQEMPNDAIVVHLTLVPYVAAASELKTKPTQHSVKTLLENGIQPDVLVLRTEHDLGEDLRAKVARFCNVQKEAVVQSVDVDTIYKVPLLMKEQGLDTVVLNKLGLELNGEPKLNNWKSFLKKLESPKNEVNIALVGKYVELPDAYKSINEAFIHAGAQNSCKVNLTHIQSEKLNEENIKENLKGVQGILVAPGFGDRGIEGKLTAVKFARENNIPFLGICLGMQCAVVEFAQNVLKLEEANSAELRPKSPHCVIDIMEEQKLITKKGGTMRLGAYDCTLKEGSNIAKAYKSLNISERHRHRYEYNNKYQEQFENAGLISTGINEDTNLVEVVEIPEHKWFVGVQFHPEYKSTVEKPHPLFTEFVKVCMS